MAEFVDRPPPVPPLVALTEGKADYLAYLIAWMRAEDGVWMGLVTWPQSYPSPPGQVGEVVVRRTRWVRADALSKMADQDYQSVPRVRGVWRPVELPLQ